MQNAAEPLLFQILQLALGHSLHFLVMVSVYHEIRLSTFSIQNERRREYLATALRMYVDPEYGNTEERRKKRKDVHTSIDYSRLNFTHYYAYLRLLE